MAIWELPSPPISRTTAKGRHELPAADNCRLPDGVYIGDGCERRIENADAEMGGEREGRKPPQRCAVQGAGEKVGMGEMLPM